MATTVASGVVVAGCVGAGTGDAPPVGDDGATGIDGGVGGGGGDASSDAPPTSKCTAPTSECGDTCVDLAVSAEHCGACNHGCLGGTCAASKCAPVKLVGGLNTPSALALATSPPLVVVAADTALYRCAKSGCTNAERMWSDATYAPAGELPSVLVNGANVYAVTTSPTGNRVSRVELAATTVTPSPLATASVGTTTVSLAADGTRIVVGGGPFVRTCLSTGCTYENVYGSIYLGSATLTPDPGGVYVFGGGTFGIEGVLTCARSAALPCTPVELVSRDKSGSAYFLQVVGGAAYWVDIPSSGKHRVLACALAGCSNTPTIIAEDEEDIGALAVDAKGAYWTTPIANTVRSCTNLATGCGKAATSIALGQTKPLGLALDDQAIYWANQGAIASSGEIMKLAR